MHNSTTANNDCATAINSNSGLFDRFISWRELHITDSGFMLLLAFIVGVLTGIAAWLLKLLIGKTSLLTHTLVSTTGMNWIIILIPILGITLTALFSRYIMKGDVSNGVSKLVKSLGNNNYAIDSKSIYGSIIGSSLTLGMGGTAGSEGPIAYAGAGIGSKIGRLFRLQPQILMILIGCGAAAGIAGIFKAPIGGALFTFEVLRLELSTVAVIGIFLATLVSAMSAYILSGDTLDINVISPGAFNTSTMGWVFILGITAGLYSLYYTWSGDIAKLVLCNYHRRYLNWILSGLSIGIMIYLFPSMYGEGYGTITDIINENNFSVAAPYILTLFKSNKTVLLIACAGILLLKGIGASATNNGGGVAGDFAPTLFAGCVLGLLFSITANMAFKTELNPAHFALIAMAASMAGIIRAPLMAIFLTTEMVGGVEFLLPATVSSIISYCIVMLFKRQTFYHSKPFHNSNT